MNKILSARINPGSFHRAGKVSNLLVLKEFYAWFLLIDQSI